MAELLTDEEISRPNPRLLSDDEVTTAEPEPGKFAVRGAATGLGFPFDVVHGVTSTIDPVFKRIEGALGIPNPLPFNGPIGGSESIEWLFNKFGAETPPKGAKPRTLSESVAKSVGETVGALPVFFKLAKTAQIAGKTFDRPLLEKTGATLTEGVAAHPALTTGIELTAGAGAGTGGFIARELFPDSDVASAIGELAGGLGIVGGPVMAAKLLTSTPLIGTAFRAMRTAVAPFTETGAAVRAERRVQDLAADPEAAARALEGGTVSGMSPATQTGDVNLMALEQAVLDTDTKLAGKFSEDTSQAVERLRDEISSIGEGGNIAATRDFLEGRQQQVAGTAEQAKEKKLAQVGVETEESARQFEQRRRRLVFALDSRLKQAKDVAESRLSDVRPERREAASSRIVREEIDSALFDARRQERELWGAVPEERKAATENARDAYQKLWDSLSLAEKDAMPAKAKEFLRPPRLDKDGNVIDKGGRLGKQTTVKELQGLRSALLEEARRARAEGDFRRARLIDGNEETKGLAEAILDDMATVAGPEIDVARDFSVTLNDKFTRGPIGRLLGYTRQGGQKTPDALTLEMLLKPGVKGEEAFTAIQNTVAENPHVAINGIQDFLKARFAARVLDQNGKVVPARAHEFIKDYDVILDNFPDLKQSFADARAAQVVADSVEKTTASRLKRVGAAAKNEARRLEKLATSASAGIVRQYEARVGRLKNRSISKAAEFLNAPIDQEISKMLLSKNPSALAKEIKKQAAKDLSGDALRGLKAGVVDYLINQSSTRTFTIDGHNILSGNALRRALKDKRVVRVMSEFLSDSDMTRLTRIADEMAKIEARAGRLPALKGPMEDVPSTILSYATRVLAARAGAQAGAGTSGASLLTAQFASQRAKDFLKNITNDKAAEMIKDAVQDPRLFRALLTAQSGKNVSIPKQKQAFAYLNAWLEGPGSRLISGDEEEPQ